MKTGVRSLLSIKYIPNYITSLRILGTAVLLFLKPLSTAFFITYTLSGLSDLFDGFFARRLNAATKFGAKLDSVADLIYYAVMVLKIFPVLWKTLPKIFWIAFCIVLSVRIFSYILVAVKYRRFSSLHTHMNKLSGFAVFIVPYIINLPGAVGMCWAVCAITALATAEELAIHLRASNYNTKNKSVFVK